MTLAIVVFGSNPEIWQKTKAKISKTGEMSIRSRARPTGKVVTTRFSDPRGKLEIWIDE